jgi:hypothetical protein
MLIKGRLLYTHQNHIINKYYFQNIDENKLEIPPEKEIKAFPPTYPLPLILIEAYLNKEASSIKKRIDKYLIFQIIVNKMQPIQYFL